jgi:hypothetical protein
MILEEKELDGITKKNYSMFIGFSFVVERGLLLGWEYYPALDEEDNEELNIYFIFICLHFKWGYGEEEI